MAINPNLPKLSEAEMNAPDLDEEGEFDVLHYPWPSADAMEIDDEELRQAWERAVKLLNSAGIRQEENKAITKDPQVLPIEDDPEMSRERPNKKKRSTKSKSAKK